MRLPVVTLDVGEARELAELKVQINIRHSYIGDLAVNLLSPASGEEGVTLHNRTGRHTRDLRRTYDALDVPELAEFAGKSAQGSWTLEVHDEAPEDTGRIVGFGLELVFE